MPAAKGSARTPLGPIMSDDTGDTQYDVGLCDIVSVKTNTGDRCGDKLLNGLKILG